MLNFSWGALALLFTFVTPSLPVLWIFRFFFPKTRTVELKDFHLFSLAAVLSLLVNGSLIGEQINLAISAGVIDAQYVSILRHMFRNLSA